MEQIRVIDENSSQPKLFGIFPGEKAIFFGQLGEREFCAIVIPEKYEPEFLGDPKGFTSLEVTMYYGKNLLLRGYPVLNGSKKTDRKGSVRWSCRGTAENLRQGDLTISFERPANYRLNSRAIQKVFITF